MIRPRTQGREVALKALYQLDVRPDLTDSELELLLRNEARTDEALAFARELVKGTREHLPEIDREVESIAHNWNLKRMAVIDRNLIRLGSFELSFRADIPAAVSINEAVVMAKKYSTKESGSFVNGILDKVAQRHAHLRPAGAHKAAPPIEAEPEPTDSGDDAGED